MKKIYKAPLRDFVVTKLEINEGKIKEFEYETPIVRKNLLFYKNLFGAYISFDYDTRLPDFGEAYDYVLDSIKNRFDPEKKPYPTISFVNENDYSFSQELSDNSFKIYKNYHKKRLKEQRKREKEQQKRSK